MVQAIPEDATWSSLLRQAQEVAPEAFIPGGSVLNLMEGRWGHPGQPKACVSPVDGSTLGQLPMLNLDEANRAVVYAAQEASAWAQCDLEVRRERVEACVAALEKEQELIARLLMWEIGKPYRLALADVVRCLEGVRWYLGEIEPMLAGRTPLGLVSNIASWNYPFSVLMHAVLVQALAGNAVIAKTPTNGGLHALTVAFALARRLGLPLSLVSGSGGELGEALVRHPAVDCLAFVGGRSNGRDIAARLVNERKRYLLEMEGVNTYLIWDYSGWGALRQQLKKGYEYGKQRCTAYARFVVERRLFPRFLETYLEAVRSLRFGHPLLTDGDGATFRDLDYGPLITARQVSELDELRREALAKGAVGLYEGSFDDSLFLPGQDRSAYLAPSALLGVPTNAALYHKEPFGPLDTFVVVDSVNELITEGNVSNGSLVASIASDDIKTAERVAGELLAFKVGINGLRSRGDREEVFGGIGQSWKGCFVGGSYLVQAVTQGTPGEVLYGNFTDHTTLPSVR
jgi:acyl-CoA reductase-like NAD-dependent aldehyde dehydrogenase